MHAVCCGEPSGCARAAALEKIKPAKPKPVYQALSEEEKEGL